MIVKFGISGNKKEIETLTFPLKTEVFANSD
jgi:hypothetical protein